jgi:hypothetical protein
VRSVARRVMAWAEAVLVQDSASSESEPAPREQGAPGESASRQDVKLSEPAPAPREAGRVGPPGGPPVQWLRDVQALQMGPPADWVERVRRGAPHLLARIERVQAPPPAPVPSRPAEPSSQDRRPEFQPRAQEPSLQPVTSTEPLRSEQPHEPVQAEMFESPPDQHKGSAPRVTPVLASHEPKPERPVVHPGLEPRETPVATPPQSGEAAQVLHSGNELIPPPPRSDSLSPAVLKPPEISAPVPPQTSAPVEPRPSDSSPRPVASAEASEPSVASYPWRTGPAPKPSAAPEVAPGEDLSPWIPHPWPVLPEEELTPPLRRAAETRPSAPWPELPETPLTESPEASALLLLWERLSRLDREQRGE